MLIHLQSRQAHVLAILGQQAFMISLVQNVTIVNDNAAIVCR